MRDYSKVSPRFWTGSTGRDLRKLGPQAQVIAFYLFTCPSANMLGLYYLGMPTLCHETGSPLKGALKGLQELREAQFAYYDLPSEHVYVPNMAREQIGERLQRKDNRHVAVLKELRQLKNTVFFGDFVNRYREPFELHDIEVDPNFVSPLQAPSKDLRKPLRSQEQEQEQEQKQEQESIPELVLNGHDHPKIQPEPVAVVFEHWRVTHKHPKAVLDSKRKRLITTALTLYPAETLCEAISGYKKSPFHMGNNDRKTVFDDIELMLRDAKQIDAGLAFAAKKEERLWD